MLTDKDQETVKEALEVAKGAVEKTDASALAEALESLENAGKILTSVMLYDPTQFGAGGSPGGEGEKK